jgi:glycosyltransferase involved in cell wall biosynthesis
MRVAFVNSTRIWSGVKTWMLEFGTELRRLGDTVHYFAIDSRFVEELLREGHSAERLPFGLDYNPRTVLRFWWAFRRLGIQVACMNIQKELRSAGIAARLLGIPVVHRVGLPGDLTGKWDRRLTHRLIVSRILVPSHAMRADLLARCPFIAPDDVYVIPNGKRLTGRAKVRIGRPVRFVMASRLEPGKRHEDVLAVLATLREPGMPPFALDIFGEGRMAEPLGRQIAALGLAGHVRLLGFSRELRRLLPEYDIGLLASENEGLPNTALEFLAAGLPVLATDAGGTAEAVRPGRDGWLYSAGDREALRAKLRECLALSDARYAEMSAAAIARMSQEFDPARLALRLHEFFAEAMRR